MSDSIISNVRECYFCGRTDNLQRHHIFFGNPNRKISERYGCWVWLCMDHHTGSNTAVHTCHRIDRFLKERAQIAWEERYGGRDDFIKTFGQNFL